MNPAMYVDLPGTRGVTAEGSFRFNLRRRLVVAVLAEASRLHRHEHACARIETPTSDDCYTSCLIARSQIVRLEDHTTVQVRHDFLTLLLQAEITQWRLLIPSR